MATRGNGNELADGKGRLDVAVYTDHIRPPLQNRQNKAKKSAVVIHSAGFRMSQQLLQSKIT
jgi:hypothetical protein